MLVFGERGNAEYLEKNVACKRVESGKLNQQVRAVTLQLKIVGQLQLN